MISAYVESGFGDAQGTGLAEGWGLEFQLLGLARPAKLAHWPNYCRWAIFYS